MEVLVGKGINWENINIQLRKGNGLVQLKTSKNELFTGWLNSMVEGKLSFNDVVASDRKFAITEVMEIRFLDLAAAFDLIKALMQENLKNKQ